MLRPLLDGFFLGLATGPYCLGICAPFMVPYLFAQGRVTWQANLQILCEFLLGRFLAYLAFGALVGWMGRLLSPHVSSRVAAAALALTSALMITYALMKGLPQWRVCAWMGRRLTGIRMPVLLGFLIGINVCPPFLVAVARLLEMGQVVGGMFLFAGFFAGTSLYTLPIFGLSPFTRFQRLQRIGTLTAILVGIWFLIRALCTIFVAP